MKIIELGSICTRINRLFKNKNQQIMTTPSDETPLLQAEHLNVEDETNALKIVLLGKTGAGKSNLANTITGKTKFNVNHSAGSGTKDCQTNTYTVNGRKLEVIDTPGLFDTEQDNKELSPETLECLIDCAPGIHAFIVLLKVEKFTIHEREIINSIFKQFTQKAMNYTIVVFTHGDQLPDDITIESWVEDNAKVKELVDKCGGHCHVFDNKYWNNTLHPYRNNQVQTENLLNTIEEIVEKHGGKYYTNETLQRLEENIQQATSEIRESSPGSDPQSARRKAKEFVMKQLWPKIKGAPLGCALGLLVGATLIPLSVFLLSAEIVAGVGVLVSAAVGALAGKQVTKKKKD